MTAERKHAGEALSALLDGRLSTAERAPVEAHLASCTTCRRELEALRMPMLDQYDLVLVEDTQGLMDDWS